MQFITKTNWIIILVVLAAGGLAIGTASSVSSCCGQPDPVPEPEPFVYANPAPMPVAVAPAPFIITTPVMQAPTVCNTCAAPVTVQRPAYKMVRETEMREEEVTTYETVWDEETRYRTRTVCKRVPETTIHKETVRVSKPVWETIEKETSYDVVEYVRETTEREEVTTVSKPVTEYQEREIVETRSKPVQETVMEQRTHQVNRPVTTYETRTRECGEYETHYAPQPTREYTRLAWHEGGEYVDPATGETRRRFPGLYWTAMKPNPEYKAERVYKPRQVTETVPITRMVPETVVEEVPVTVERVVQEKVVRKEQVPVTRMVEEKVVNKIPVTTYKPVTKKVVKKTPVKVCRTETVDEVREVPVTTYKMVTETIQEPYTVKIARQVPKVTKVKRPYTVCRRVPLDACAPVTVSSPVTEEPAQIENSSAEPVPAETQTESSEPADTVPAFNPPAPAEQSEQSTSNYPSDSEEQVITTDDDSSLPAVPGAEDNQEASLPKIAAPEAVTQAPPLTEADKAPELNNTGAAEKEVSSPLPAPKSAIQPSKNEVSAEKPITTEDSEKSDFLLTANSGQFRTTTLDSPSNQQKPSIPSRSPTDLLK